jgi:hypothetical protein
MIDCARRTLRAAYSYTVCLPFGHHGRAARFTDDAERLPHAQLIKLPEIPAFQPHEMRALRRLRAAIWSVLDGDDVDHSWLARQVAATATAETNPHTSAAAAGTPDSSLRQAVG